jgi:hypothetical protein
MLPCTHTKTLSTGEPTATQSPYTNKRTQPLHWVTHTSGESLTGVDARCAWVHLLTHLPSPCCHHHLPPSHPGCLPAAHWRCRRCSHTSRRHCSRHHHLHLLLLRRPLQLRRWPVQAAWAPLAPPPGCSQTEGSSCVTGCVRPACTAKPAHPARLSGQRTKSAPVCLAVLIKPHDMSTALHHTHMDPYKTQARAGFC